MPALQVRDLPDAVYEQLKELAQTEHRSLAQQTVVALEHYLATHRVVDGKVVSVERSSIVGMHDPGEMREQRIQRRRSVLKDIAARPPHEAPEGFPSTVDLVRQGREERMDRVMNAGSELWQ